MLSRHGPGDCGQHFRVTVYRSDDDSRSPMENVGKGELGAGINSYIDIWQLSAVAKDTPHLRLSCDDGQDPHYRQAPGSMQQPAGKQDTYTTPQQKLGASVTAGAKGILVEEMKAKSHGEISGMWECIEERAKAFGQMSGAELTRSKYHRRLCSGHVVEGKTWRLPQWGL